jgi:hypothetical protein
MATEFGQAGPLSGDLCSFSDKAIGRDQAVMMSITLAVSIDYSLFILSRYREEIMQGLEVGAAVEQSLGTAGHTVLVSGTTLAVHALFDPALLCM